MKRLQFVQHPNQILQAAEPIDRPELTGACVPLSDEDFDDETIQSMRDALTRNVEGKTDSRDPNVARDDSEKLAVRCLWAGSGQLGGFDESRVVISKLS